MKKLLNILLMASLCSCASVMNGTKDELTVNTDPPGANVEIWAGGGSEVIRSGVSPYTTTLPKKNDGYFQKKGYYIVANKEGYDTGAYLLSYNISGWYFGNLIFGGPIGLLVVDPLVGGMWKLDTNEVNIKLKKRGN